MPRPSAPSATSRRSPRVAIIGAGMSGMCMAIRLLEAGHRDLVILEKAHEVGGTWRENRYPGVACDVPSRHYTYSFAPNPEWSSFFPPGEEIWGYFKRVADAHRLRESIRFGAKVERADWNGSRWVVQVEGAAPEEFDFVVAATGILHHPRHPAIAGLADFEGHLLHSAVWDTDVDLSGKRVGVIGNGSTGSQIITSLSTVAGRLSVFQRTPQWILPVPNWQYSAFTRRIVGRSKRLSRLSHRFYQWVFEQSFGEAVISEGWQRRLLQGCCRAHLRTVRDAELRRRLTPDYQPLCRRVVITSGFYRAIGRGNVDLVTDAITEVTATGVRLADGTHVALDALVLATGFDGQAFLRPIDVHGENGATVDEAWAEGPRAYRTVALPDFPNFLMLVGPNSPFGNFSVITIAETAAAYALQCIELWASGEVDALAPTQEATDRYNAELRAAMPDTVWATGCQSWYLGKDGVPVLFPWSAERFRELLATPDLADYAVSRGRVAVGG